MRTERSVKFGLLAALAATALGSAGCSSMSNTAAGAGIGGALGTGAGLALGAATGNPRTGAVAGGLLGAGVGAAVGNDADRQERREIRQTNAAVAVAQAQSQGKMGMMDVIHMVQAGHSDQVIVNQIHQTGSTFQTLSQSDLDFLKASNVPDSVIVAMQNVRPVVVVPQRRVVVQEPTTIIYERPPVYVAPAPVFVGGGYYRRW